MKVILTKQRVAKNGLVSYRQNTARTSGVIYVDPRMFTDAKLAPLTFTIEAEGLRDVVAEDQARAEAAAKEAAENAAKAAAAAAAAAAAQPQGQPIPAPTTPPVGEPVQA